MSVTIQPRPEVGAPTPYRFPSADAIVLDNGLTVLSCHVPGKPLVALCALLDHRADAEQPELAGVGTILARTLDEGTLRRDAEQFAAELDRRGATLHADARGDGLYVTLEVPAARFASALALFAEALREPAFPEQEVERVVSERLDEIEIERATPDSRARIELGGALWAPGTRAALPVAGSAESVTRIDRDVVTFAYARAADPARTTVVVAGDLTGIDVAGMLGAALGDWASAHGEPAPAVEPAPGRDRRVVVVDRPGSVQTQLAIGHPSVDRRAPDWAPLGLGVYVLGGTLTSRIDAVLREEKGYTYGMRASVIPRRRRGTFVIGGSVDTESTDAAVADLVTVLDTALNGGLTEAEVEAARRYLVGVAPLRWETPTAVAEHLAMIVGNDLPMSWTDEWLSGLDASPPAQVDAALRAHVRPEELVTVAVGDAAAIAPAFQSAGLGEVSVVAAEG